MAQKNPQSIQFGTGRACINPAMPISLSGYFNTRIWEKVLDDLEVRVLVLNQDDTWAALIQYDLVSVSQELANMVYAALKTSAIKPFKAENIILAATPTHTAPVICSNQATADSDYFDFVVAQTLVALKQAQEEIQTGELVTGLTTDRRFLFNRRFWMHSGGVITNPGKLNPDIDCPEGEIDPEIPLVGISQNGSLKVLAASIVNHCDTIGGNDVSCDWPGFTRRNLEKELGLNSMVIPLIGASGNINHFDVTTDKSQTSYSEAERIGTGYAETISRALPKMVPVQGNTLLTRSARVAVQPRVISPAELKEAQDIMERYKDLPPSPPDKVLTSEDLAQNNPDLLRRFASKIIEMAGLTETVECLLTGIFIGNAGIVSLPCEPFTEIGLTLRKVIFPKFNLLVTELSNGSGNINFSSTYIPNPWNFGRGGYETAPRSSQFEPDTATRLINAWRKMAETLPCG